MVLRALVFDFDGLIADTEWPEYRSVAEQFEVHGLAFPPEEWIHVIGSSWNVDWLGDLERRLGRAVDRDELTVQRRARLQVLLADLIVLPGVVGLLERAHAAGLRLAVASSSPRSWVEPHLERFDLRRWFDAVRTRDDVARTKPAPDLFLEACAALGVDPGDAVALEDSANGARAARAAGLRCVVVPNRLTALSDLSHADLRLETLLDLALEDLGALCEAGAMIEAEATRSADEPVGTAPEGGDTIAP
jgi:HAD superfamily hydrolase (TIGR01509 family)